MFRYFFLKFKSDFRPGSALLVTIFILAGVFIMAFGASYLVLFNIRNSSARADALRADAAAEAGAERIRWEVRNNAFNLNASCTNGLFSTVLPDESSYVINCDSSVSPTRISAIGSYKSARRQIAVSCLNVRDECMADCGIGAYCGGGILVSTTTRLVVAPSGCSAASGSGCSNAFAVTDTAAGAWDALGGLLLNCTDLDDGRNNVAKLGTPPASRYQPARFCDDLAVNGFSNWYLPARNEVSILLRNSNRCTEATAATPPGCQNGSSTMAIIPGFAVDYYWSSTDVSSTTASGITFSNGASSTSLLKNSTRFFHCVRRY